MKFSEMPYKRVDVDKVFAQMDKCVANFIAADSAKGQLEVMKQLDEISRESYTMISLCNVRNTINTKDAFYAAEREYCDSIEPLFEERNEKFNKALAASPFRKELQETLGEVQFLNLELQLKSFSPEIVPLMQEDNALQARYQNLIAGAQIPFNGKTYTLAQLAPFKQNPDRAIRKAAWEADGNFFDQNRQELDEIFDKIVKNRTAQAKKLGMENFVELGYARRSRNCYGPKEVANFRSQVVRDLVPVVRKIKATQAKRTNVADFKIYDDAFLFPDGNANPQGTPDELLAAGKKMYTELSPQSADFIKLMFDMELFDVVAKEGKAAGGYCTEFPTYHCPFIFSNFNGTAGDVDVLTHEAGHAFASYIADKKMEFSCQESPSMEGCESHSMSMEFLTEPWHHLFFKDHTKKYELSHAESTLIFIPYGSQVDHFQEIVYSNPDMTPDQRNEAWAKLDAAYRPYLDAAGVPCYGRGAGWQRQQHIYTSPFYYIDYCLAQTVALQIWSEMRKDWDTAWKKYYDFVCLAGTKTFVELVKSANLVSPLEEGCVRDIAADVSSWLEAYQL